MFVYLIDQADRIVAQSDHPPDGGYATGIWDAGEQIVDRHRLAPAGRYQLRIGLYDATTLARVRLAGSADDLVSAATVEVSSLAQRRPPWAAGAAWIRPPFCRRFHLLAQHTSVALFMTVV